MLFVCLSFVGNLRFGRSKQLPILLTIKKLNKPGSCEHEVTYLSFRNLDCTSNLNHSLAVKTYRSD